MVVTTIKHPIENSIARLRKIHKIIFSSFRTHCVLGETNNSKNYTKTKTVIGISSQQTRTAR